VSFFDQPKEPIDVTLYHPIRALGALACAGSLAACASDNWGPDELLSGKTHHEAETLKRGQEQYSMYCAGCHGVSGDGEGPAARFLNPKPRDFRKGRVKFAAVPAGTLPRDEDLIATMNHGLTGTSMPSWRLIAEEDKRAIVAYLKTFSEVWQKEATGTAVGIKPDPWRKHPERGVAEGEKVYHGLAACTSCHPAYVTKPQIAGYMKEYDIPITGFRADLYASVEKDSEWGAPILPPDFLRDHTKSATTRDELVRVIAAGVGGTAMPSWGSTLTHQQLWGLAYYVESLIEKRATPEAAALQKSFAEQPEFAPPPEGK
jgi:mono/diheme cytochrome c family protein